MTPKDVDSKFNLLMMKTFDSELGKIGQSLSKLHKHASLKRLIE